MCVSAEFFFPVSQHSLIHICRFIAHSICTSLHPSIPSCTVSIWDYLCPRGLPGSIPLILGKNWITRRAEKRRRAVISYNIEQKGLAAAAVEFFFFFFQRGNQNLSQKLHTEGKEKESGRRSRRQTDRQTYRGREENKGALSTCSADIITVRRDSTRAGEFPCCCHLLRL